MREEKQKIFASMLFPMIFALVLWMVWLIETMIGLRFAALGIYPLSLSGMKGILFSPLIHSGHTHLLSNTFPLIILGTALFYFYPGLGWKVTLLGWLMSGLWIWVFARQSYHIGASTIIYMYASFLFVSGILRDHPRLMALSLLVIFLYGSMVWGIFPLKEQVSWEGHLMGMAAGVVLALFFKHTGPQRKLYSWELEPEEDVDEIPANNEDNDNNNTEASLENPFPDENKSSTLS